MQDLAVELLFGSATVFAVLAAVPKATTAIKKRVDLVAASLAAAFAAFLVRAL